MNNLFENKKVLQGLIIAGVVCLCIFFIANAKNVMHREYKDKIPATISVTGSGEFFAIPDTATFTFSVEKEAVTQKEASDAGAIVINKIIDALKADYEMNDKDLKTTNLNISPKYQYNNPCYGGYCPPINPKVIGYTFNQSVSIKIKNLDKAGEISAKLAEWGATNVYGPDFTLADEDEANGKARQDAITDAKVKANVLAKQLGIRLGKIQSFSENNGGGVYPMAYDAVSNQSRGMMEKSVVPQLPTGENKYTSTVNIVYEIK